MGDSHNQRRNPFRLKCLRQLYVPAECANHLVLTFKLANKSGGITVSVIALAAIYRYLVKIVRHG